MWGRQSFVGLSSQYGGLTLGRQYTPHYNAIDNDDPFGTGAGSAYSSGILSSITRADNSVVYEMPKVGGVTGSFMVSLSEGVPNNKLYSGQLHYGSGPFGIAVSADQLNTPEKMSIWALTGQYDFGVANLLAGVQSVKNVTGALGAQDDRTEYYAGVQVPAGPGTASFGYGSGKFKNVSGTHASQWSAGYTYALSKRTSLYGVFTDINNDTLTAFTADTATGSGPAVSASKDVRALQVGIRHKF